ncbi:MAG: Asp-tRNA(Asn)/Glu-tRNA(Gln) amidotransferase subunit GatC [Gammaproteobacteria bacterium]|nr:Asp-tRNA(Asn)/Glu-tRNA(Gln) amidotransferase subunit GatC [Gammaproteobacteria bacterium]
MNIDDLKKIAQMAHIQMSNEELNHCDLGDTLAFIDQIKNIDTANIEPFSHPLDICQRLRDDKVTETNQREMLQKLVDHNRIEAGLYLVPEVL